MTRLATILSLAVLAGCGEGKEELAEQEPAFPVVLRTDSPGMGLRDYFAIHAPPLPDASVDPYADAARRQARWRYEFADAMMIEREGATAP